MKTKAKEQKTTFTFWRENLKENEYTMSLEEIKTAYRKFLATKNLNWIQYYGHETVTNFVSSKDGLNSVVEQSDISILQDQLRAVRHEFYPEIR